MLYRLLLVFLFFHSLTITQAQIDLTPEQWREDLRHLQHTVHQDYQPLFKKVSQEDFDAAVESLYKNIPEMQDHEVIVGIAEIVALFGYGHTALWLTSWRYNRSVNFRQMPYNLYQFTDGIYVQGVHRNYEKANGARVLTIGETPVEEALSKVKPVFSAENDQFFKAHGFHYLGVPEILHAKGIIDDMSSVTLQLEKAGQTFEMTFRPEKTDQFPGHYGIIMQNEDWVDARKEGTLPNWLKQLDKIYYYEYLPESKTVYVRQSEVQDDPSKAIPEFYAEVFDFIEKNDVEKMVIDVRLNSGGNNYKNKPVVTGLIKCEKINQPGKLFVVLGRRTFSACQNLVNELENYTNAIFIGEPTAENVNFFGDNRTERLPNSDLPIRLSYLWWQDKDPRDNRPWTPPHVAVDLSFDEYVNNIDPVMETIINYKGEGTPSDPWQHLVELFMAGKLEELSTTAQAYVKDPKYKYYDFEDKINQAGYDLMGNERYQEAQAVLQMNTDLFPESANCWDSLAECNWKLGNVEEAKKLYNKAITLDPDGPIGQNARDMLKQMEGGH